MGKATPEEKRMRENADIVENSRSRGCKAGADLKEGIDDVRYLTREDKGQGSEEGPENPAKGYNQYTFLGVDMQVLGLEIRAYAT